jgi:fructose-1,6-bisphosphatase/inositol monophosphatase family enzyme
MCIERVPALLCDADTALKVATAAAMEAGVLIRAALQGDAGDGDRRVMVKSGVDLVTETDQKCETLILSKLRAAFPTHGFVGEESTFADGGAASTVRDDAVAVARRQ